MPSGAGRVQAADIRRGVADLGLALNDRQVEQLEHFAQLLLKWNGVHNLTALTTPAQVLSHHLLDSLAIIPELMMITAGKPARVLDIGAGGGLPGIPLAIACEQFRLTLIDKVQKKTAFLTQAKMELDLEHLQVVHDRVERWTAPAFDLIVSRAFSSLADFVSLARHLAAPGATMVAMKGVLPTEEIEQIAASVARLRTVKLRVPLLDAERHLILIQLS